MLDNSELIHNTKACIMYQKDLQELGPATRNTTGICQCLSQTVFGAQHPGI